MPYKRGDILFFSAPPQPNSFAKTAMKAQWILSCLSCKCTDDYKKTHVAVCVGVKENKDGKEEVLIAQFNSRTYEYEQRTLTELSSVLKDRRVEVLRPTDEKLATALADIIASEEAKEVRLDNRSMAKSLCCCSCSSKEKTVSGLSVHSHCSRFVAEAISIADKTHSFGNANVTVSGLFQRLSKSKGFFERVPIMTESENNLENMTPDEPLEIQLSLLDPKIARS